MVKNLIPQHSPRAAHALTLLSSLIALTACGGGQSDSAALASDVAAGGDTTLETAAALTAKQRLSITVVSTPVKATTTTTTATSTTTTSAPTTASTTTPTSSTATAAAPTSTTLITSSPSIGSGKITKAAASTACGVADVGGWTIPVPAKADTSVPLKNLNQPGSRLFYISAATGSDSTGQIYFWNGSAIIDSAGNTTNSSGAAYGTDPMNPSSAVKPYKRWSFVGPRNNGGDIGSAGMRYNTAPSTRAGYPDWWMFARGETFDLTTDTNSYLQEFEPSGTSAFTNLGVSGGRSASEPQVVGAYGSSCSARPRFIHPVYNFVSQFHSASAPVFKNVAYLSLHFDGHGRTALTSAAGLFMLGQPNTATNILFEDVWFDAAEVTVSNENNAQVTLRRSVVTDAYSPGVEHVQGVFYSGGLDGKFRIEDSILLRNGFHSDPKTMAWPPTSVDVWDMFNRNLYLSGKTKSMESGLFDSVSMLGASGDQFRPGMRSERNFFYQGYVMMGAQGGKPDSAGATGTILDNVLQRFVSGGTAHPGWGFGITAGANAVEISRNIVTGAQYTANTPALTFDPGTECPYVFPTRNNKATQNIFDAGTSNSTVETRDGTTDSTACASPWTFRGVSGNTVSDNIFINSLKQPASYLGKGGAAGTSADTLFQNNSMYGSRAEAASALGWSAPNRTLKTYLQANGITVTSTDGFPEYLAVATQMQRGKWRNEWTAKPMVNHIRSGFGMSALP